MKLSYDEGMLSKTLIFQHHFSWQAFLSECLRAKYSFYTKSWVSCIFSVVWNNISFSWVLCRKQEKICEPSDYLFTMFRCCVVSVKLMGENMKSPWPWYKDARRLHAAGAQLSNMMVTGEMEKMNTEVEITWVKVYPRVCVARFHWRCYVRGQTIGRIWNM